jgi:hypothetical protein
MTGRSSRPALAGCRKSGRRRCPGATARIFPAGAEGAGQAGGAHQVAVTAAQATPAVSAARLIVRPFLGVTPCAGTLAGPGHALWTAISASGALIIQFFLP